MHKEMDCPSCNSKLYETDINGVQAFNCNSCSGWWMSGSALDILFRLEGNKTNSLSLKAVRKKIIKTSNRSCPTCKDKKLSTISNAEADICSSCAGVYLAFEELEKFIPDIQSSNNNGSCNAANIGSAMKTEFTLQGVIFALTRLLS